MFDQVSPSNQIILFLSLNCDACNLLERSLPEIEGVEFVKYWVIPSRVSNKLSLRADKYQITGVPVLIDADELPVLPAAFDPNTQELIFGVDPIFEYLKSCELLDPLFEVG